MANEMQINSTPPPALRNLFLRSLCGSAHPAFVSVVARSCGVILLAAVALKVQGMTTSGGVDQSLSMLSPRMQLLGVEVEAIIGVWLLSGFARRGAWLAAIGLFAILAAVSVYLVAVGQPSCGCFGRVEVSPWASLTLDVICVVALVFTRPAGSWQGSTQLLMAAVASALIFGALAYGTSLQAAGQALARLRGEQLILTGGDADAGTAPRGSTRDVSVTIENVTSVDLHLIGGTASCSCVATSDLPLTVPAGSRVTAQVTIKFTGEPGQFKHTFQWYTDSPRQPRISGTIAGQVVAAVE